MTFNIVPNYLYLNMIVCHHRPRKELELQLDDDFDASSLQRHGDSMEFGKISIINFNIICIFHHPSILIL